MVTKKELTSLAKNALGRDAKVTPMKGYSTAAWNDDVDIEVKHNDKKVAQETLAAALRGIIAWKERKE